MSERILYSREAGFQTDGEVVNAQDLSAKLLTPEEAQSLADELNRQFADSIGKSIEIDCGKMFIVGDGEVIGTDQREGRDMSERYNSGIKRQGILERFDVLPYRDSLLSRGTGITVNEPCVVYREPNPVIHRIPEAKVTEIFVPIIRLSHIKQLAE